MKKEYNAMKQGQQHLKSLHCLKYNHCNTYIVKYNSVTSFQKAVFKKTYKGYFFLYW